MSGKEIQVTIITVVLNCEKTIERSILSVINQTYKKIEYIIIDGLSKDNSVNIIKNYESKLKYWISEKDMGIYDAMNKGISVIDNKDSYILFLNADDYLLNETIIETFVAGIDNADFVYGKVLSVDDSTSVILGNKLKLETLPFSMIQHQATFTRKALFDKLGMFDTKYKIAADYDFAIRVFKSNSKIQYIDLIVTVMQMGGASSKLYHTTFYEKKIIIKKYYNKRNKIKAFFFINYYEIPKHLTSNYLNKIGLLTTWRKIKNFIKLRN
jgi:glycosyltransferase involved in cell wall biosynthesis